MKTKIIYLATFILTIYLFTGQAIASNYQNYCYNMNGDAVLAPESYSLQKTIYCKSITGLALNAPTDIAVNNEKDVYILDAGNDRIVVLTITGEVKQIITPQKILGKVVSFKDCAGIFVTNQNEIYLADKENGRILVLNSDGSGKKYLDFQKNNLIKSDFIYRPIKVIVDKLGIIMVVSEGCYDGILSFDTDGKMIDFFGANKIEASLQVVASQFWKNIFTQEQRSSMKQSIPVEYSSECIDNEGFIYTTTINTTNSRNEIKKLNPKGNNILQYLQNPMDAMLGTDDYGDLRSIYDSATKIDTALIDISVDAKGFIFTLDKTRGRVFQYDQESTLVNIFGGIGAQKGTFMDPIAIETQGENVLVLDKGKNSLFVFTPNDYAKNIRQALLLNQQGLYEDAYPYWQAVLEKNSNYQVAYSGIGKAFYKQNDYKSAMKYFKLGYDRVNYDVAYNTYRTSFVRTYFPVFSIGAIALILVFVIWLNKIKKRGGEDETGIS